MKTKLRAFTVLEMLVVMIVSTLVIAFAYKSYEIFSGLFRSYQQQGERIARITLLDHYIRKDFRECHYINSSSGGFNCYFNDKIVKYEQYENYWIRRSSLIDTFFIKTPDKKNYLLNEEVLLPDQYIDRVSLNIISEDDTLNGFYKKEYPAEILMQIKSTAENGN